MIPVFIFVINFQNKTHFSETGSISDTSFKAWPFSSDFNFAFKDGRVTTATCKYYCPWIVSPTITNCCKKLHLKCGRVSRSALKMLPCMKTSPASCENQSFFLLFQNVATFIESHCVFLCYFLQYDEAFLISLSDGCYHC